MNMVMSDYPLLPTPYPTLFGLGDPPTVIPVDQAKGVVWSGAPWDVQLGNTAGITIADAQGNKQSVKDAFTSGFSKLYDNGLVLVKSDAPPSGYLTGEDLVSTILGFASNPNDQKSINDNRKRLTSTVQNIQKKGYYFIRSGGTAADQASPAPSGDTISDTATSISNAASNAFAPIASWFAPSSTPAQTYQRSGGRTRQKPAARGMTRKQKNQLVWYAAIGGIVIIGSVLMLSAD